jgi:hypothetical protein
MVNHFSQVTLTMKSLQSQKLKVEMTCFRWLKINSCAKMKRYIITCISFNYIAFKCELVV